MRRVIKSTVLTVAGVAGLLSILWLVAGGLFGVSLVIFKTGSMSPTMPTGTAAIEQAIPASAIRVGDVITLTADGAALPTTHRVMSVSQDPADAAGRIVVMRGDANSVDDVYPYHATSTKRVLLPIPGLGFALMLMATPLFTGAATLLVAALVIWAFWPDKKDAASAISGPAHRAIPELTEVTK